MKQKILCAALTAISALALLSMAALAQQDGNMSGQDKNMNMNKSMMNSMDKKFVMEAAMGGMAEVELGRLATERGMSDEVKQFGQRMVDDHSKANEELMQVASAKGMTLPTTLDAKHQAMVDKMSKMSGAAFDKAYKQEMLKDHRKDVASFEREAGKGMDAEVKGFAAKTLPTLKEHLSMIEAMNGTKTMSKGSM
jgi:putative membrane protein